MSNASGPPIPSDDHGRAVPVADDLPPADLADRAASAADIEAIARDRRADGRDKRARAREVRRGRLDPGAERDRQAAKADRVAASADRLRAADDRERASVARSEADQLRRWSTIDSMTGVLRREAGLSALSALFDQACRVRGRLVVAFVDVDSLKGINDSRGHGAGDDILRAVAATLTAAVRDDGVVMRYGGDEFLIGSDGLSLAEVISRLTVAATDLSTVCEATMTFGTAHTHEGENLQDVIDRADAALYATRRRLRSI